MDGFKKCMLLFVVLLSSLSVLAQPPTVTFSPANLSVGAAQNTVITVTYSEPMRIITGEVPLTSTNVDGQVSLRLTDALGATLDFGATINGSDDVITITPDDPLPPLTLIYVSVAGLEAISDDDDVPLASATFTTADNTPPTLTFTPADGAINIPIGSNLVIDFNEAIRNINDSDIDDANVDGLITLKLDNSGGLDVLFDATINAANNQITINPNVDLNPDQDYYLSIGLVEDAANNATAITSITFTTTDTQPPVPVFTPLNGATGVIETNPIVITFLERIRRASDNATFTDGNIDARITLVDEFGNPLAFNATINDPTNTIVTITPSSPLPGNTDITVTIAGIEDGNNNAMSPDPASVTFTTGDTQAPVITATVPADEQDPVLISTTTLQITFNENVTYIGDAGDADVNNHIRIRNVTTSTFIETIPNANISIIGNVVNITFASALAASTNYAIQIGNSVFEDGAGNDFTGISNNTTWDFDTEDPPNVTGYSADPTCMGETINIQGARFGAAVPTVTINGIAVTPSAHTPTSITVTIPTTTAGNATVVVTNNSNGLGDSDNSLTLKAAIAASLPITANPPTPAVDEDYDVVIDNTQDDVFYGIRELPSVPFLGSFEGDGNPIDFGPYNKSSDGTFQYEVRATSSGCTTVIYSLTVNIAALSANAGGDVSICNGDSIILGGSPTIPTASGGTGFFSIKWYKLPSVTPFSTASNPLVKPNTTSTYRVVVADSPSNSEEDFVTVTVRERLSSDSLKIQLTPPKPNNVYSKLDDPVLLNFTRDDHPGTYVGQTRFEGQAVNTADRLFYPAAANLGPNSVTLNYENEFGCLTQKTITLDVSGNGDYVTGLLDSYCEEDNDITSIQMKAVYNAPTRYEIEFDSSDPFCFFCFTITVVDLKYTYLSVPDTAQLIDATTLALTAGFSTSGTGNRNITLNTSDAGVGKKIIRALYQVERFENSNPIPVSTGNIILDVASFVVTPKPTLRFVNFINETCENGATISLSGVAEPVGGTFEVEGLASATFNPSVSGLPDITTITYLYTDPGSTCSNTLDHDVVINRLPAITDIIFENGCVGDTIDITPVFSNPELVNFTYTWDVDGSTGPDIYVPSTSPDPIKRIYLVPSNYTIALEATRPGTLDPLKACSISYSEALTIGQVPDLSLSWANVCDGDATRFGFKSDYFKNNLSSMDSVTWRFGDATKLARPNPSALVLGDSITNHTYAGPGIFIATVSIRTDLNCIRTDTVRVYKVAKTGVIGETEYLENFNVGEEWKSGGTNSSWEWGTPAGTVITADNPGGGKAWVTNLTGVYNTNEDSWVHSPCFNLSQIERPILSFDFISQTRNGIDGAVLQYNSTGSTNRESDWKTLGAVGSGKNWYNRIAIGANPGNQALLQTGWTGETDTLWRTATIPLDVALSGIPVGERSRVRMRIAFGSSVFAPGTEGFAFDNFRIAQRDRLVLLEQFTNNGGANTGSEPNKMSNQALNNFLNDSFGEVMKLEYHLGVSGPNEDPIHLDNPVEANARAAFYGVSSTPTTFMDARHGNLQTIFAEQTLKPADVTIDTIFTTPTPASTLNIEVQFTPKTNDLPPNSVLHIVVIEKQISNAAAVGTNGETTFKYVMKKMLPNALGTRYPTGVPANTTQTVNVSWSPKAYLLDSLAILAFVQNEDTKEIYQTRYLKNPLNIPAPGMITGTEPSFSEQISIYPNPAQGEFNIELPKKTNQALPVSLIDGFGREVYNSSFKIGEQLKTVNTSEFSGGVYILQIRSANGEVARKKLIVTNK